MIEVDELVKRYGPALAVDGISFDVEKGEIVGLLGPNGAGKTTTMRILSGYLPATSGRAAVAGHDLFDNSLEARRHIGYLPEGMSLYPEMRVHEYLTYRAHIKGVARSERRRRVGAVLEQCRITDVRRKLIGSLSKGYQQRVGLADALVNDPPVLILDEPTIGLDPNQIRQVRDLIRNLGEDRTVLLSTHILPEVEMICGRVLIMNKGRLVFGDRLANIADHGGGRACAIVELKAPAQAASDLLGALPGVKAVHVEREDAFTRLRLDIEPHSDVREAIGQCVVEQGWELRELRVEQPSLEDIFVRLIAKEEG